MPLGLSSRAGSLPQAAGDETCRPLELSESPFGQAVWPKGSIPPRADAPPASAIMIS